MRDFLREAQNTIASWERMGHRFREGASDRLAESSRAIAAEPRSIRAYDQGMAALFAEMLPDTRH